MLYKAIGSRVDITLSQSPSAVLYRQCISDLLEAGEVRDLDKFEQHLGTSRLQHSLNVSYYSFLISKFLHCDYRSAARAGILHDLYLYDRHIDKTSENHIFRHPREALKNAEELTDLNAIEKDAIINHMFPLSKGVPRYKESYVVSVADKYSAVLELGERLGKKVKHKLSFA